MSQAIILHGTTDKQEYYGLKYPSLSNMHWLPWLQKNLLVKGVHAHTPEVFEAYDPTYEKWLNELNRFKIDSTTILIGHSCGGGFLLRWLSENDVKVGRVILVAPWIDPERAKTTDMFEFDFDESIVEKADKISVFYSTNDFDAVQKSIEIIKQKLPNLEYREFKDSGHFCINDIGPEFPELLEECLR